MPQTLRTGDFTLRALPQVPRIDPANFDARIGDLLNIYGAAMQMPARLEGVRSAQRQGRLERAMEPQTLELAKQRAAQELELAPYRVAAEKQKATTALDQPGGIYLSYDAAGNLVQNEAIVRTDPLTGESETILVPKDIKTAEDVAAGRENTRALAAYRESLGQAAITNAAARTTASDAALKRAERPAAGQRGRGVTREISDTRGNPVGVGSYEYDANGRLVRLVITPAARKDVATGRLIQDQPYEMPLPGQIAEEPEGGPVAGTESTPVPVAPAGTDGPMAFTLGGVTYRADQTQAPVTSPALPPAGASAATSPAPPAPVAMQPTEQHIAYLRKYPQLAAEFDAKFGAGAAARILGGQ